MKIGLLSYCKTKRHNVLRTPAKDLYQGVLFKAGYKYLKNLQVDRIYILSALYGLIYETDLVGYYELRLAHNKEDNLNWANSVITKLSEVADLDNDVFIILAGNDYMRNIVSKIKHYVCPLVGCGGLGCQLQWLKKENLLNE